MLFEFHFLIYFFLTTQTQFKKTDNLSCELVISDEVSTFQEHNQKVVGRSQ